MCVCKKKKPITEINIHISVYLVKSGYTVWTFRVLLQNIQFICNSLNQLIIKHNLFSGFQTFAMFWMLFYLFWVIPRRLNFFCRSFGALCQLHLHRWCKLWQSVLKRRHIKFRRRRITRMKEYNITVLI
jgi:hypothetical protein